jgi:copper chaperone CopZ
MTEIVLTIEGMHCGTCVRRVSQALAAADGLTVGEVRVGAARVTATDQTAGTQAALDALAKAGFKAQVAQ